MGGRASSTDAQIRSTLGEVDLLVIGSLNLFDGDAPKGFDAGFVSIHSQGAGNTKILVGRDITMQGGTGNSALAIIGDIASLSPSLLIDALGTFKMFAGTGTSTQAFITLSPNVGNITLNSGRDFVMQSGVEAHQGAFVGDGILTTMNVGGDLKMHGTPLSNAFILSNSGLDITVGGTAFLYHDTFLSNASGDLTLRGGIDVRLVDNAQMNISNNGALTIIVDNQFSSKPFMGSGGLFIDPNTAVSMSGFGPVRVNSVQGKLVTPLTAC